MEDSKSALSGEMNFVFAKRIKDLICVIDAFQNRNIKPDTYQTIVRKGDPGGEAFLN